MSSLSILQEQNQFRTDKGTSHFYLEVYDTLFEPYRFTDGAILELGVQWGGSISLWSHYFSFKKIVGVDIAKYLEHMPSRTNIQYIIGDAYTPDMVASLETAFKSFDIIIDDGPHDYHTQEFVIHNYSPLIKQRGLLIIEDVNRDNIHNLVQEIYKLSRPYNLTVMDRNSSQPSMWNDNSLIIVEFV